MFDNYISTQRSKVTNMLLDFNKKEKKLPIDSSRLVIFGEYLLSNIDENNLLIRKEALLNYLQNEGFIFISKTAGLIIKTDLKPNIFRFYKKNLLKSSIKITITDRIEGFLKNIESSEMAFFNTISRMRLDLPADITIRFTPIILAKKDGKFDVKVEIEIYPIIYLKYTHIEAYRDEFQLTDLSLYSIRSIGLAKNIGASLDGIMINEPNIRNNRKIFVVHGRDETKKIELKNFLKAINIDPIILDEQKRVGKTLLDKFEYYANSSSFAIVLMTGDDFGGLSDTFFSQSTEEGRQINENDEPVRETRARQNVIIEFGYFWGRLGINKICILCEEGVKMPSDVHGVSYFKLDNKGDCKQKIADELDNQGIKIDMNLLKQI